jgi:predicted glycoside hydrolase/deacetylase ChbG (UPF0249 family)
MVNICLCADDYAISPGVSRGILELIAAKRLTAVSVITASDYWPEWSQALLPLQENIDVGLHIVLTNLKPLGQLPTFASTGQFPSLGTIVKKAYLRILSYEEIKTEIEQQLQRFYLYFGCWPSHIDGHHHVHILPGIRELIFNIFCAVLDDKKRYIRNCVENPSTILQRQIACVKAIGIGTLSYKLKRQLIRNNIPTNNGFAGIYDFNQQQKYSEVFPRFLMASKNNMLIMCHPGYVDKELSLQDPVLAPREAELKFLLSNEFTECLAKNNVLLTTLR